MVPTKGEDTQQMKLIDWGYRNERWEMRCPNTGKKRREREETGCLVELGLHTNIQRSMDNNSINAFGGALPLSTLPNPNSNRKMWGHPSFYLFVYLSQKCHIAHV